MSKKRSKFPKGRLYRTIRPPKPWKTGRTRALSTFYGLMPRGYPPQGFAVWRTVKAKFNNPKVSATKVKR